MVKYFDWNSFATSVLRCTCEQFALTTLLYLLLYLPETQQRSKTINLCKVFESNTIILLKCSLLAIVARHGCAVLCCLSVFVWLNSTTAQTIHRKTIKRAVESAAGIFTEKWLPAVPCHYTGRDRDRSYCTETEHAAALHSQPPPFFYSTCFFLRTFPCHFLIILYTPLFLHALLCE